MRNHALAANTFLLFLFVVLAIAGAAERAHAESVMFSVTFPKVYEEWMRDEPKHVNHLTINALSASVEYRARVVNVETGQVVPSGSTVPQGTQLKLEFLPENMAWHTTGNLYDTPYAHWTNDLPPAPKCDNADMIINQTSRTFRGRKSGNNIYSPVYAQPPAKTAQNASALGSCSAPVDGDTVCTASNVGTHTIDLEFAPSKAYHYVRVYRMDVSRDAPPTNRWPRLNVCEPMGNLSSIRDFTGAARNEPRSTVTLPAKTLPFTVTVVEAAPPTDRPQRPSIAAAGGACTIGTPYGITITASHPQNSQIRYLIDWNDDGTADQTVPSSGYVGAGTAQTASRTFATAGTKMVRVRAQDEEGMLSEWATLSFSCAESTETAGLVGENEWTGVTGSDGGSGSSANDLTLRVLPSLVRPGNTTNVHWSSQNMAACTVSGTNGDGWSVLNSPVNGELSSAITGQVTYTLSCTDSVGDTYTKSGRVNVLPSWTER